MKPFRVHLLCEEGFHQTSHEGYVVLKPSEFIKAYGCYIKVGIWLMLFGAKVASHGLLPSKLPGRRPDHFFEVQNFETILLGI